jgi:hypothetical protein
MIKNVTLRIYSIWAVDEERKTTESNKINTVVWLFCGPQILVQLVTSGYQLNFRVLSRV